MTSDADPTAAARARYGWPRSRGYSELTERLGEILLADPALVSILDAAPPTQRQPGLLFAALHDRVLAHPEEPLARWYPSVSGRPPPDADPAPALHAFFAAHGDEIRALVATRSTQTNDPLRCASLAFGFAAVGEAAGRPLGFVELGASAGLLLLVDRYRIDFGGVASLGDPRSSVRLVSELRGPARPPLPTRLPAIASRVGIDLAPVDARDEAATRWLLACILADRLDRIERFRGALALARRDPPRLVRGDITLRLAEVAASVPADEHLCLFDSYALVYLTPPQRAELAAAIAEVARGRDLDWISAERPGTIPDLVEPAPPEDPHATFLAWCSYRGGVRRDRVLARCHTHGEWVEWL